VVSPQGLDLGPELGRALVVTTGEGHSKGKFKLFELVIALGSAALRGLMGNGLD
jgi:hypothetical protein